MNGEVKKLGEWLKNQPIGPIADHGTLSDLLSNAWNHLRGSSVQSTTADKIGRMEKPTWNPPLLEFELERHGGTVMGSTRAELHHWWVNIDGATAGCERGCYRQLIPADTRLDIVTPANELADAIIHRRNDDRLKWDPDRNTVRVLVGSFLQAKFKATLTSRRKRFRSLLVTRLAPSGWVPAQGKGSNVYCRPVP